MKTAFQILMMILSLGNALVLFGEKDEARQWGLVASLSVILAGFIAASKLL